ncbi:hypothetical protein SAMN04244579_02715 [Azotobacter beijerinckii]|uniref:Uncharacterized protein n=1 Tax=Azotobacter beijerinckii TaxID=170623 RepID=A0A1H6V4V1_9GAMM|nr:hypothetical protein [Azotobacter beijerinckii]SEI98886.1 hypothetical protein SAMN04244579_02715 [Azotobacter beijerinckii]
MALLDVTEVLLDPDFMDTSLVCRRMAQSVGDDGRAESVENQIPFAGVVTSDKGDILERLSGGERKKGSITIHTVFRLSSGSGSDGIADIVTWQGRDYTVSNVNDYNHFGRGFVAASCDLLPLAG